MDARPIVCGVRLALLVFALAAVSAGAKETEPNVRPAACAGSWYPADADALSRFVDDLFARAAPPTLTAKPVALIAPHAGYRFSAPVAAAAYRCLKGHEYKRVIVLAFSHRSAGLYQGIDVPATLTAYQTPLGNLLIDREVCDALLAGPGFASHPGIDRAEHSLELQLPFLQKVLGDIRLVPLLVGRMEHRDFVSAAEALVPWVDDQTLLVASSDFTHFGPNYGYQPFKDDVPNRIQTLADEAAAPILAGDCDGFLAHLAETNDTICGRGPICLLLRILSMQGGAEAVRAAFDTSGRQISDWSNSVTYQSFVLTRRPHKLVEAEHETLLRIARQTIASYLNGADLPRVAANELPAALCSDGACFVTLENHGRLRGCIGNMIAAGPMFEAVIHNALSACRDGRFVQDPVTANELNQLHIEISYLTPMLPVSDPDKIVVGRHGLLIELGQHRGVLLPQVAYERGWSRQEFLAQTCRKAGLPIDAWKNPDAKIYCFEAEVFGEPEPPSSGADTPVVNPDHPQPTDESHS